MAGGYRVCAKPGPPDHRLVYIVTEAEIIILAARYHY
jgi:hypothetical protein